MERHALKEAQLALRSGAIRSAALLDLVENNIIRTFAVVGTPEQCAVEIRALLALGFQGVSCSLAPVSRSSNCVGLR